ncbi:MAG: helix-turn-helix domain-containing protein [Synergistaceae bacterium]|nr:helix-turn-helix domain-containing protein [Synergistaceae bacterium]
MPVAERIKRARERMKLTQRDVAALVGISPITLGRWEWGQRTPRFEDLSRLAAALDTTVSYLSGETEEPSRERAALQPSPLNDDAPPVVGGMGTRIRALRKSKGLSQSQLGEKVGADANTVSRWENERIEAGHAYMVKLADALGTTTDHLLGLGGHDIEPTQMEGQTGGRIKHYRDQLGLTQEELAHKVGVHVNTIRRWEQGKQSPDARKLASLADAFGTTTAHLLDSGDAPQIEDRVMRIPDKLVKIKVLSIDACMGKGFDNDGEPVDVIDELWVAPGDVGIMGPDEPFAIEVHGASMAPTIEDGVRVIVNPNIPPGHGDICLARFLVDGWLRDAVKFYYPRQGGGFVLKASEGSGVPPMEFTSQDVEAGYVRIVGRVMSYSITVRL